jgi:hypothetical protein
MRLWSLHPRYLDTKGLLALWREGLLAQKVLAGKTKGYKHHPQLKRFQNRFDPQAAIGKYLLAVWKEADRRGYDFEKNKIKKAGKNIGLIPISRGQLRYEWEHLRRKLNRRDPSRWKAMRVSQPIKPHPSFRVTPGPVAVWEKL